MENKELTDAGNALVHWFNSQEIGPNDALAIMSKVLAKIMVSDSPSRPYALDDALDNFILRLVHDINDRSFTTRKARRK